MNKYVPHQNSFDVAKKFETWQSRVLLLSTSFTVISIILNNFHFKIKFVEVPEIINWLNIFSSIFAVAYIVLDVLINDKFCSAGKEKRLDLIDHAFNTNYTGEKSVGYFNADGISSGVYKLAVLDFENSLFTSEVAKKMLVKKWGITIGITLIFIFSACLGNKLLVNNILQIAATGILIQQTIRLQQFYNKMNTIHSDFKNLFNDLKGKKDKTFKNGEMIRNVLNYESTHSWGCILLDSNQFDKLNPELSSKWEKIKTGYNIV